jgi:hypothetical protein
VVPKRYACFLSSDAIFRLVASFASAIVTLCLYNKCSECSVYTTDIFLPLLKVCFSSPCVYGHLITSKEERVNHDTIHWRAKYYLRVEAKWKP